MIPMTKMESVGIRKPISSEEVEKVYDILGESDDPGPEPARPAETWNRRYTRYKLLIKSGSVNELAAILKALHQTNKTRALSLGERIIAEKAMDLLVGELMCARDMEETAVRCEIGNLLRDE
jgi:RNA polymerase-interacting CarD/CdnL/TRCF family regulator